MSAFFLVFLVILSTVWGWVWFRLVEPAALPELAYWPLALLFVASFALQFLRWIFRAYFDARPWLQQLAYFFFGQMIILLFAALAKDAVLSLSHFAGVKTSLTLERSASGVALAMGILGELWASVRRGMGLWCAKCAWHSLTGPPPTLV
jgi:hypothetical protein